MHENEPLTMRSRLSTRNDASESFLFEEWPFRPYIVAAIESYRMC